MIKGLLISFQRAKINSKRVFLNNKAKTNRFLGFLLLRNHWKTVLKKSK
jgi:hypothetical protein